MDNLQPDFLYDHIAPVRHTLMQALWRTVSSNNEQAAIVAFRILGKFGGSNRRTLVEPCEVNDGLKFKNIFVYKFELKIQISECDGTLRNPYLLELGLESSTNKIKIPLNAVVKYASDCMKGMNAYVTMIENSFSFVKTNRLIYQYAKFVGGSFVVIFLLFCSNRLLLTLMCC